MNVEISRDFLAAAYNKCEKKFRVLRWVQGRLHCPIIVLALLVVEQWL